MANDMDQVDKLNHAIEAWLEERQELIVLYCACCGVHQQIQETPTKIQRLKTFCQIMVDYCSAGHFEIYPGLIKEAEERDDGTASMAQALLPKIQDSTDIALEFNDRYETEELPPEVIETLVKHLSKLGEILVSRFEYEDQLVQIMHSDSHSEVA